MKATRLAVLTLAFLATACTGTLVEGRADSVSSSLVEYLYPAGEKPPSPSRKIPSLPLPLRIGIAFVPSPQGPSQDLSEAERFKLLYDLKTIFSKHDFVEEVAVIPEQYLKAGTGFAPLAQTADTYGLNAMALVSYDQVSSPGDEFVAALPHDRRRADADRRSHRGSQLRRYRSLRRRDASAPVSRAGRQQHAATTGGRRCRRGRAGVPAPRL